MQVASLGCQASAFAADSTWAGGMGGLKPFPAWMGSGSGARACRRWALHKATGLVAKCGHCPLSPDKDTKNIAHGRGKTDRSSWEDLYVDGWVLLWHVVGMFILVHFHLPVESWALAWDLGDCANLLGHGANADEK